MTHKLIKDCAACCTMICTRPTASEMRVWGDGQGSTQPSGCRNTVIDATAALY
jgi:hypothetical protein